jgi:hypothetical protein
MHFHISRIFGYHAATTFVLDHNLVNFGNLIVNVDFVANIGSGSFAQLFEHSVVVFFYNVYALWKVLNDLSIISFFDLGQTDIAR